MFGKSSVVDWWIPEECLKGKNPLGTRVVETITPLMSWSPELEVLLVFRSLQGTGFVRLIRTTSSDLYIQPPRFTIYPDMAWIPPHSPGLSGTCGFPASASAVCGRMCHQSQSSPDSVPLFTGMLKSSSLEDVWCVGGTLHLFQFLAWWLSTTGLFFGVKLLE